MIYLLRRTAFTPDQLADRWAGHAKFFQHLEIGRLALRFDRPGLTVGDIGSQRNFKPLLSFAQARSHCVIDPYTGAGGNGLTEIPPLPYPVTLFRCLVGPDSAIIPDNYFDILISVSVIEHIGQAETNYDCKPLAVPDPLQDAMRDQFCAELARILKPGGITIHTIDHAARNLSYLDNFARAGLVPLDPALVPPTLDDCLNDPDAVRQEEDWVKYPAPIDPAQRPLHGVLVGVWRKPDPAAAPPARKTGRKKAAP